MNELEQYLKTATRGLWGKRKLEVREELKTSSASGLEAQPNS